MVTKNVCLLHFMSEIYDSFEDSTLYVRLLYSSTKTKRPMEPKTLNFKKCLHYSLNVYILNKITKPKEFWNYFHLNLTYRSR